MGNQRFVFVDCRRITIAKSSETKEILQIIEIDDIKSITVHESAGDIMDIVKQSPESTKPVAYMISYLIADRQSYLVFRIPDDSNRTTLWALTIDGLKYQKRPLMSEENGCCMDNPIKILLLRKLFKSSYAGGIVKSADEEWQYNSDGSIVCLVGKYKISYTWTGEFLQPSLGNEIFNFGTGKWDGVSLFWFPSASSGDGLKNTIGQFCFARKPWSHYLFCAKNREYLSEDSSNEWKWSRHFLASKEDEPEWIVEGEIPEPVVMLLQMMRYYIRSTKTIVVNGRQNISSDDVSVSPTVILRARKDSKAKRPKSFETSKLNPQKFSLSKINF